MELVGGRLAEAMQRGARLVFSPDPARPIIRCSSPEARRLVDPLLGPDLKAAAQAMLGHAAAYRRTLLDLFRMNGTPEPTEADMTEARRLVGEEMRLVDDLGPALADAVRAQVMAEWGETVKSCPLCGEHPHAR